MSDFFIRSQNKEQLINFSNFYSVEYDAIGTEDNTIICVSDGGVVELATYGSKERCIEVLDEIQKVCGQYLYAAGSAGLLKGSVPMPPMASTVPRMYQMPEK